MPPDIHAKKGLSRFINPGSQQRHLTPAGGKIKCSACGFRIKGTKEEHEQSSHHRSGLLRQKCDQCKQVAFTSSERKGGVVRLLCSKCR